MSETMLITSEPRQVGELRKLIGALRELVGVTRADDERHLAQLAVKALSSTRSTISRSGRVATTSSNDTGSVR
jgi:hypothetical protein